MKTSAKIQVALLSTAALVIAAIGIAVAETPPAATAPGGTLDQRVVQRKAERVVTLDKKASDRLINSCVEAQTELRLLQKKDVEMLDNRNVVYGDIDAKLLIVIGELKLADKDTFELDKERLELASQTATIKATAAEYKQALDDTMVMNCKADVVGFQAMLDTTRLYNAQLRQQATGIRNYVVDTIRPTLEKFVDDLEQETASEKEKQAE